MTDDRQSLLSGAVNLKSYREILTTALFHPGKPAYQYPYQRGFNEGVSLAIKKLDEILKGENHD